MGEKQFQTTIFLPDDPQAAQESADLLIKTLEQHDGIIAVELDMGEGKLSLAYDPDLISAEVVDGVARDLGLALNERVQRRTLTINSSLYRNISGSIVQSLSDAPDVFHVSINPVSHTVSIRYRGKEALAEVEKQLEELGYPVVEKIEGKPPFWVRNQGLIWAGLTLVFLLIGVALERFVRPPAMPGLPVIFFALAYAAGGHQGLIEALHDLRRGRLNVDFLMILAALGAAVIGQWAEGAMLLFLFTLAEALEDYAMDRTRSAVEALTQLRPNEATVRRDGEEISVPVEQVHVGEIVVVRPGESIPVDGRVLQGETTVDQSSITGESVPVHKTPGDDVFAGTINLDGAIDVRVTKEAKDTTLARVIEMVSVAQSERAPTQRLIDRFAHPYAIGVLVAVALVMLIGYFGFGAPFEDVFYKAMTLLVVASPCALVISTPASVLSGIAAGARNGVLFKGGVHLENAARVDSIAFDKTGTLTLGRPQVTDIIALDGLDEEELLRLVASAEVRSEHPIARAIVDEARSRGLEISDPEEFRALPGKGVRAQINGREILVGSTRLLSAPHKLNGASEQIAAMQQMGKTTVLALNGDQVLGVIAVADLPRANAAETIAALRKIGVKRIAMLTGDYKPVAESIARRLGVDEVYAELLPTDKVDVVRKLQEEGPVIMVGDGVNDAPALALADVGMAMGAAGADVAMETADIVLMSDDLSKIPFTFTLARKARTIIIQNFAIALGVMALLVLAAFVRDLSLPVAVVGHEGSTLVVVLNGLRLLRMK